MSELLCLTVSPEVSPAGPAELQLRRSSVPTIQKPRLQFAAPISTLLKATIDRTVSFAEQYLGLRLDHRPRRAA